MNELSEAESAVSLLRRLEAILKAEQGGNWLQGIRAARSAGEQHLAKDPMRAIGEMASIYRTMNSGPGSFDDFFIWRESPDERVSANEELDRIKEDLWRLLT